MIITSRQANLLLNCTIWNPERLDSIQAEDKDALIKVFESYRRFLNAVAPQNRAHGALLRAFRADQERPQPPNGSFEVPNLDRNIYELRGRVRLAMETTPSIPQLVRGVARLLLGPIGDSTSSRRPDFRLRALILEVSKWPAPLYPPSERISELFNTLKILANLGHIDWRGAGPTHAQKLSMKQIPVSYLSIEEEGIPASYQAVLIELLTLTLRGIPLWHPHPRYTDDAEAQRFQAIREVLSRYQARDLGEAQALFAGAEASLDQERTLFGAFQETHGALMAIPDMEEHKKREIAQFLEREMEHIQTRVRHLNIQAADIPRHPRGPGTITKSAVRKA